MATAPATAPATALHQPRPRRAAPPGPAVAEIRRQGVAVLPAVFTPAEVDEYRRTVVRHLGIMPRTRRIEHSRHLAGFHRYKTLLPLHEAISAKAQVRGFLHDYYDGHAFQAIGVSDITVNRSQPWHTDLLRGTYRGFLSDGSPWRTDHSCIKALVYLQPGTSLRFVPGSHATASPLDDDELDELARGGIPVTAQVEPGDVVMMDIRTLHRGSTDADLADPRLAREPRILVSTVFGRSGSTFTQAMSEGNAQRQADWDRMHLASRD